MFQVKWIWKNLEGCRKRYVFGLFSTILLAILSLGNSLIISNIMDTVFNPIQESGIVTEEARSRLIMLVSILIGFTFFRTSFQYLSTITYEACSQKLVYKLRRDIYANMQAQDSLFYSRNRIGDLMTRLTGDMDMVRHATAWVLPQMLDCVFMFTAASVCFLVINWQFALSLLVITPIIFLLTKSFAKTAHPLFIQIRERLSELNTNAQENIAGNRVVKAFAREEYEEKQFDEKNKSYHDANIKANMKWMQFSPYIEGFSQSLSVAVLLVGGLFLIQGRITIGQFTLFNGLSWTLSNPMRMIGMLINDMQRFFASANKVIELFYARSTIVSREDALKLEDGKIKGDIEFRGASLKIDKKEVLKDINLKINKGETVAIMGPTGSGKTSLVNLIPRMMDVGKGKVLIDGESVSLYNLKELRSCIGIATQDVFLFSDTVDGNIAYGDSKLPEEKVKEFAKMAAVDFAEKLSDGFDTLIGERGTGLSGGQKQRIALARALAVRPSILILDDTTSAVDMETEKYIQNQLDSLDFECTKVIVAQRISTTKRADRIVILNEGEIVDIGTHEELIARPGYYREVYCLQNGIQEEQVG
ncbi:ABC transporter ATP-binding protein [Scatolibacter rhodanostii]|uniref:ABC transporter ATP-binding protein n=1 Tax=Scatolibacter rhodanostii TaxID=2014781 RepID=UPI000C069EB0|nr:ABC transporter ATP-binding protein [Scatolibacter rhodanostii]